VILVTFSISLIALLHVYYGLSDGFRTDLWLIACLMYKDCDWTVQSCVRLALGVNK
jgi:hypothetical protein